MASKIIRSAIRDVTPVFSANSEEAKKRVLTLYKAWYRHIPTLVLNYDVNVTIPEFRKKLRAEFDKNKDLKDIRVIDMLVIKGQMELVEIVNVWKNRDHILGLMCKSEEEKPKDFLTKFYNGHE